MTNVRMEKYREHFGKLSAGKLAGYTKIYSSFVILVSGLIRHSGFVIRALLRGHLRARLDE